MYLVSIVAYQAYQDRCRPHKGFHTGETECACAQILCKRLKFTDGCFLALLSGIEELTTAIF